MTEANLERANSLKNKISIYSKFLGSFSNEKQQVDPIDGSPLAAFINPVFFTARYIPGVEDDNGNIVTAGKWEITDLPIIFSGYDNNNLLELVNTIAPKELDKLGNAITNAVKNEILNMQEEFNNL